MKTLLLFPRPKRTRGNTLMVTVFSIAILSFLLVSYLTLVNSQNQAVMRSQAWNVAIAVVEAGIEEALAHLNRNASNTLACDGWAQSGTTYTMKRPINGNYYIVTISNFVQGVTNSIPTIWSRGYVPLSAPWAYYRTTFMAQAGEETMRTFLGRGVIATAGADGIFSRGLVARDTINLNGNNISTDSFDSTDPTGSTNGLYHPAYQRANGDVAANSSITNAVNIGDANILGHVAVGAEGTIAIGPNGSVGDLDWNRHGHKGIQEGYARNDMNMSFPDVQEPFQGGGLTPSGGWITNVLTTTATNNNAATTITYPAPGYLTIETNTAYSSSYPTGSEGPIITNWNRGTIKGYYYPTFTATYAFVVTNQVVTSTYYDYIFETGNYQLANLDGSVYVAGDAVVYVTTTLNIDALTIKPGEHLELYSSAASVALAGNHTLNSDGYAANFRFWGMPSVRTVTFNGNAGFTGTIYAPNADFILNGAGNNSIDFIGASVTRSVWMNGHFNFHYDESLARRGPNRGWYVTSWNEMLPHQVPLVIRAAW